MNMSSQAFNAAAPCMKANLSQFRYLPRRPSLGLPITQPSALRCLHSTPRGLGTAALRQLRQPSIASSSSSEPQPPPPGKPKQRQWQGHLREPVQRAFNDSNAPPERIHKPGERIKSINSVSTSDGPDEMYHQLVYYGQQWSDRLAEAEGLEEGKKMLLAELILGYMDDGSTSRILAESKALADERYKEYIDRMVETKRLSNRSRVEYDALKIKLELVRTWEASRRAELNAL
eukprot:CAMPEP_0197848404 /NCGR_PEP_ID=MMETSP1438-20131217/8636_1 /TAXON_ID=1461541 /ORGANISM="Pterosperma sp., Strain CCMP1384" /LENGTH=231 /DNA_ID=CAMNT_0043460627 /DNA_START=203 /DNA_END=898 /DNA_ORIENTATION=+